MHTHERPGFFEQDVKAGRWTGIPLLVMDDASSAPVKRRLSVATAEAGARLASRQTNGGPPLAARDGVKAAETSWFMLVGDDDYFHDWSAFSSEAAEVMDDEEILFVSMPEVRSVVPGKPEKVQFDRRVFDGMSGGQLLRELVFGGEIRALQAGTMMRSAEALPHFAGSLFRTSEDYVLLARICAAHPERKVRVLERGAYMRREHERSLSHRTNVSPGRLVVNLAAVVLGGRLLQRLEEIEDRVLVGLLRQRGQVLATVYGRGVRTAAVIEALLTGSTPDLEHPESQEALAFLVEHHSDIPPELSELKDRLASIHQPVQESPGKLIARAGQLVDQGEDTAAQELVLNLSERDPDHAAALLTLKGQLALRTGDANLATGLFSRALVADPTNSEALHQLGRIARAAGLQEVAARLENRLREVLTPELRAALDLETAREVRDIRVAFIVSEGLDQFLDDIIRELLPYMDARKFVVRTPNEITSAMEWAEVCWFEWCNDPLIWASRQDIARQKGIICRLHRYEAFSDMPLKVQWDQVDALVVVASHLAELVGDAVAGLKERTLIRHIPNGVDLERFEFTQRQAGFDIALIGYLHGRKNPAMALQILHRLVQKDDRYRLHVAGKFQDPVLRLYWHHMVRALKLSDHVVMYEWQSDIARFLEDKQYLLSTSLHESFGYSIAEAMARGIKPVVHNFPFAEQIWASEMLFDSVDQAVQLITEPEYTSRAYRAFVEEHYSLEHQVDRSRDLILSVASEVMGETVAPTLATVMDLTPQMVNASVQGTCPACGDVLQFQQQTVVGYPVGRERCPSCRTMVRLDAEHYADALGRHTEALDGSALREQTRAIRAVATSWSTDPVWQEVMAVGGIDLGRCMEFELTPVLVGAWLKAQRAAAAV